MASLGAQVRIRSYCHADLPACQRLYRDGLLGGKIAENDTGLDIDDIEQAYMNASGGHFWVAENEAGEVVGMIGVQQHETGTGEIRRLRVHLDHRRRGIGTMLVEQAVKFCNEQGYLKLTLDTFIEREPAIKLFEKFHFHHSRTREYQGKELLYFYLDLYEGEKRK
jgi:ribosomal protein S18 acetylase RimI-like enzyme